MKYRIKIVEKNSGEKEYIPQYLDIDKMYLQIYHSIIFFPLTIIYFICNPKALFTLTWWEYVSKSEIQTYNLDDYFNGYKYKTQEEAMNLIDVDKEFHKKGIAKKESEECDKQMNKIKSISYFKY